MSQPSDLLFFYSKSADKPPGKGASEQVASPAAYARLASFPHWRQTLSNFHVCPFVYGGSTYRTIEHAFQAEKIRIADPAAAAAFTVESGSNLGARGDGLAARKQRKVVRLSRAQIAQWDATSDAAMGRIQRAKFTQCAAAAEVLLSTKRAQLWHVVPRSKPVRFVHLERVREELARKRPAAGNSNGNGNRGAKRAKTGDDARLLQLLVAAIAGNAARRTLTASFAARALRAARKPAAAKPKPATRRWRPRGMGRAGLPFVIVPPHKAPRR